MKRARERLVAGSRGAVEADQVRRVRFYRVTMRSPRTGRPLSRA